MTPVKHTNRGEGVMGVKRGYKTLILESGEAMLNLFLVL